MITPRLPSLLPLARWLTGTRAPEAQPTGRTTAVRPEAPRDPAMVRLYREGAMALLLRDPHENAVEAGRRYHAADARAACVTVALASDIDVPQLLTTLGTLPRERFLSLVPELEAIVGDWAEGRFLALADAANLAGLPVDTCVAEVRGAVSRRFAPALHAGWSATPTTRQPARAS